MTDAPLENILSPTNVLKPEESDMLALGEIQVLLAEKRTSLSVMNSGIAVFVLPLSVMSFLIGASKYYDPAKVMALLIPVLVICAALCGLGVYLVVRAIRKIRRYEAMILEVKKKHSNLSSVLS